MVKIEDIANSYVGEKKVVTVEGPKDDEVEFSLKYSAKQMNKLAFLAAKQSSAKPEELEAVPEERQDVVKEIIKDSYSFDEVKLDHIMKDYGNALLLELELLSGIKDRKSWEALKAKRDSELKKFTQDGQESTPSPAE